MDRICPFLALDADRRTVVDGFDPDHRCRAVTQDDPLDRSTQVQLCIQPGHRECDRFKERMDVLIAQRHVPRPAPDATFSSTRLVIRPDSASWRPLSRPIPSPRPARMVAAGAAAVAVLGGAAAATTAGFGLLGTPSAAPSASPIAAGSSSRATATPAPTPSATPTATPRPTRSAAPTPSPTPAKPARTPAPTPRVYVVQAGDTLNGIAIRFGVSAAAIQRANSLSGDLITIGQSLIIP